MPTDGQRSVKLSVRVIPGASRDEFAGVRGAAVVVHVRAKPIKGAANRALIEFLSGALQISSADISIVAGQHSRDKALRLMSLDAAQLKQRLRHAGAL